MAKFFPGIYPSIHPSIGAGFISVSSDFWGYFPMGSSWNPERGDGFHWPVCECVSVCVCVLRKGDTAKASTVLEEFVRNSS